MENGNYILEDKLDPFDLFKLINLYIKMNPRFNLQEVLQLPEFYENFGLKEHVIKWKRIFDEIMEGLDSDKSI
jgi:hypothetical protein